jgi:hypothetical protein
MPLRVQNVDVIFENSLDSIYCEQFGSFNGKVAVERHLGFLNDKNETRPLHELDSDRLSVYKDKEFSGELRKVDILAIDQQSQRMADEENIGTDEITERYETSPDSYTSVENLFKEYCNRKEGFLYWISANSNINIFPQIVNYEDFKYLLENWDPKDESKDEDVEFIVQAAPVAGRNKKEFSKSKSALQAGIKQYVKVALDVLDEVKDERIQKLLADSEFVYTSAALTTAEIQFYETRNNAKRILALILSKMEERMSKPFQLIDLSMFEGPALEALNEKIRVTEAQREQIKKIGMQPLLKRLRGATPSEETISRPGYESQTIKDFLKKSTKPYAISEFEQCNVMECNQPAVIGCIL